MRGSSLTSRRLDHRACNHFFLLNASNLVPRSRVPFGQHQDKELWNLRRSNAGHSREHARSISLFIPQNSTVNLRHSSHLGTKFNHSAPTNVFSRVLLLRQQPFSSENLPPERPTTTIAIKTPVFMFRYESVNSTRKFTIVAEIVSLLKKIYKRDALFRAVFKVKTLAVLFSAYPREMKHIPRNLRWPNTVFKCLCLIHHYF